MKPNLLRRQLFSATVALFAASTLLAGHPAQAADDTLAALQKRGTLRVGIEGTYPPFNYQDENGQFTGFEIDLARAIAEKMGLKAEFQPTKWDGLLGALDTGRIDVIINQVTISDARQHKYDFSQPYTVSGIQAVVRKKDADAFPSPEKLAGKKVGVVQGTNYEEWLRKNVPAADIRTYDDDPTRNQDLVVGRLDAILVDRLAALYQLRQTGGRFALSGPAFSRETAGIPTRKSAPELHQAIEKALTELRADGTLKRISEKWFGADVTQ